MKTTLGESKTETCQICHAQYHKTRFDQKFCSKPCREEAKKFYKRAIWFERPDREKQNARRKQHYLNHRKQTLAQQKQWRLEHPEEDKIRRQQTYERNKEKHIARCAAYRAAHPEIRHKEYENRRQRYPWQEALANARNRSAKKKFAFDLTREWCIQNWTGRCAVSNLPFAFGTQSYCPFSPSIDRIRSDLGYTQDNCRFVLFAVNNLKGAGTDADMLRIAEAIVSHQKALPPMLVARNPDDDFAETRS